MFALKASHEFQARMDVSIPASQLERDARRLRKNHVASRWKREKTLLRKAHELAMNYDQAVTLLIEPKGSRSRTKIYTNNPNRNRAISVRDMMDYDYPMPQLFTPLSFESTPRPPPSQPPSHEEDGESSWSEDDDDSDECFPLGSPIQLQTTGQHHTSGTKDISKHAFHVAPDYSHISRSIPPQLASGNGLAPAHMPPHDSALQHGTGDMGVHSSPLTPQPRFYPLPQTPENHPESHKSIQGQLEPRVPQQRPVLGARVEKATGRGRGHPRGRGGFRGGPRGQW